MRNLGISCEFRLISSLRVEERYAEKALEERKVP
jgi:hypothetical protein